MSIVSDTTDDEKSFEDREEVEKINIGLYIGGRNKKGVRHGRGWAILPNGDQFDGHYCRVPDILVNIVVVIMGCFVLVTKKKLLSFLVGIRSGRGIFVYPDGSYYEGMWRKNLKHGKGRYLYPNGDTYCGDWYRNRRHGVGVYFSNPNDGQINIVDICSLRFTGTWHQGVQVGPFELSFGNMDKSTTLHGTWDNLYPQGPCVFSFDNRYLLMGYFQAPGREDWLALQSKKQAKQQENLFIEEVDMEDTESKEQNILLDGSSVWYVQDICAYDPSLLPQEPVPLPISDSEISVCSISTTETKITLNQGKLHMTEYENEAEEEGDFECVPCESISGAESSSQICTPFGDPCAIEISPTNC